MQFKKPRLTDYYATMIVALHKARPISALENGRELIGRLTQLKITTSNVKNSKNFSDKSIYTEKDQVVPVFLCNPFDKARDVFVDWTRSHSPITEIKCATVQRWWPKAIFQCSQKLGDIAEEIVVTTSKFVLHSKVEYAYSFQQKDLFDDIPDYGFSALEQKKPNEFISEGEADAIAFRDEVERAGENLKKDKNSAPVISENRAKMVHDQQGMIEKSITAALFPGHNENADGKSKVIIDRCQPLPRKIGEAEVNTSVKIKPEHIPDNVGIILPGYAPIKKKSHVAVKVALGFGAGALLGLGIYFGVKFFLKKGN
jgi:hypothetical protein